MNILFLATNQIKQDLKSKCRCSTAPVRPWRSGQVWPDSYRTVDNGRLFAVLTAVLVLLAKLRIIIIIKYPDTASPFQSHSVPSFLSQKGRRNYFPTSLSNNTSPNELSLSPSKVNTTLRSISSSILVVRYKM